MVEKSIISIQNKQKRMMTKIIGIIHRIIKILSSLLILCRFLLPLLLKILSTFSE